MNDASTSTSTRRPYCFCLDQHDEGSAADGRSPPTASNRRRFALECGHSFHRSCLKRLLRHRWLDASGRKCIDGNRRMVTALLLCPLCRHPVCPRKVADLQVQWRRVYVQAALSDDEDEGPHAASSPPDDGGTRRQHRRQHRPRYGSVSVVATEIYGGPAEEDRPVAEVARKRYETGLLVDLPRSHDASPCTTSGRGRREKLLDAELEIATRSPMTEYEVRVERSVPDLPDRVIHSFRVTARHLPSAEDDAEEDEMIQGTIERLLTAGGDQLRFVTPEAQQTDFERALGGRDGATAAVPTARFRQRLRQQQQQQQQRHHRQQQQQQQQQLQLGHGPESRPIPRSTDERRSSSSPPLPSLQELFPDCGRFYSSAAAAAASSVPEHRPVVQQLEQQQQQRQQHGQPSDERVGDPQRPYSPPLPSLQELYRNRRGPLTATDPGTRSASAAPVRDLLSGLHRPRPDDSQADFLPVPLQPSPPPDDVGLSSFCRYFDSSSSTSDRPIPATFPAAVPATAGGDGISAPSQSGVPEVRGTTPGNPDTIGRSRSRSSSGSSGSSSSSTTTTTSSSSSGSVSGTALEEVPSDVPFAARDEEAAAAGVPPRRPRGLASGCRSRSCPAPPTPTTTATTTTATTTTTTTTGAPPPPAVEDPAAPARERALLRETLALKRRECKLRGKIRKRIRAALDETDALSDAMREWAEVRGDLHSLRDGDGTSAGRLLALRGENGRMFDFVRRIRQRLNLYRTKVLPNHRG